MKKLLIDSRMRQEEKNYLTSLKYDLIELLPNKELYDEISAHPDIQVAKIGDSLLQAPNANILLENAIIGNSKVGAKFPESVHYNVCCIGDYLLHNLNYTDSKILELADNSNMTKVHVNQGYTKCSIAVTSNNSCITTDKQIYKTLLSLKIDCLYIEEESIRLINKFGLESKMRGFIGGASTVIDNKFILFGDKKNLKNLGRIEEHIKKYNLEFIDFPGLSIHDYGGVIET